jgi:hypothetical protein
MTLQQTRRSQVPVEGDTSDSDLGGRGVATLEPPANLDTVSGVAPVADDDLSSLTFSMEDRAAELDFSVLEQVARIAEKIDPEKLGLQGDFSFLRDPDLTDTYDHDPGHVFIEHWGEYHQYFGALKERLAASCGDTSCGDERFRGSTDFQSRSGRLSSETERALRKLSIDTVNELSAKIGMLKAACAPDFSWCRSES